MLDYQRQRMEKKQISELDFYFVNFGITKLVERLRKGELDVINEECALPKREKENKENKDSAPVLRKRLRDVIDVDGLPKLLESCNKKALEQFCSALDLNAKDTQQTRDAIINEVRAIGLRNYVSKCDTNYLCDCIKAQGFKVKSGATRKSVVDAFIYQINADEVPEPKDEEKISRHKPDIKKGVSGADLFQWYNVDELIDYCKEKEITISKRKKKYIIEDIIIYLEK